mmetsp:Transcript_18635/g.20888  ORF Transcript_18635/g.20888 Transcript_18635/m.20888 type:complete len:347 (+) Transcript_18635:2-1042(+)
METATITTTTTANIVDNITDTKYDSNVCIENKSKITNPEEEATLTQTQTHSWQSNQTITQQRSSSSSLLLSSLSSSSSSNMISERRDTNNSQEKKMHMARQIAEDIRLVQDILVEHSLDPSMAPQLAISLQSSQHIVESQREMCYQNAMLDAHQRRLDRQLSEQQHRESLQGVKYDPNWKEKLQIERNQCYYWNIPTGGVSRLWWEVLLIQQLTLGAMPVWQYYYTYHYLNNINNNNNNNESTNIYENDHEIGQQTASFIKDTIASVLAQVCDCQLYYEGSSYSTADTDADIPTTTTTTKPMIILWRPMTTISRPHPIIYWNNKKQQQKQNVGTKERWRKTVNNDN